MSIPRIRSTWGSDNAESKQGVNRFEKQPVSGCGYLQPTREGEFLLGHVARLKGRLLATARAGEDEERTSLLTLGMATEESIAKSPTRATPAERDDRQRERISARAGRLRQDLAEIEPQLAN